MIVTELRIDEGLRAIQSCNLKKSSSQQDIIKCSVGTENDKACLSTTDSSRGNDGIIPVKITLSTFKIKT